MLVLLPPPMSTSLRATGENRPFFPDLLFPVEFCFVIRLFCFLKLATVSFQSFMKKTAWMRQVSFRPLDLESLKLALVRKFLFFLRDSFLPLDLFLSPLLLFNLLFPTPDFLDLFLAAFVFLFRLRSFDFFLLLFPSPPARITLASDSVSERLFVSSLSAAKMSDLFILIEQINSMTYLK